jgi:CubicO group peptidase (beta-lactamase class C family)
VKVRHVLSHTSAGTPGYAYSYSGNTYHDLTFVVESLTRKPYAQTIVERILRPLEMTRTVPGHLAQGYETVMRDMAFPYVYQRRQIRPGAYPIVVDPANEPVSLPYEIRKLQWSPESVEWRKKTLGGAYAPDTFGAAAGLISCVSDLAKFDAALDQNVLISQASKESMWAPAVSNTGETLPYALGWFVQEIDSVRVVWHYGLHPPSISSLYIKVPDKEVSFFLLANTDRLSSTVNLGDGDVRKSPFARAFLSLIED